MIGTVVAALTQQSQKLERELLKRTRTLSKTKIKLQKARRAVLNSKHTGEHGQIQLKAQKLENTIGGQDPESRTARIRQKTKLCILN